MSTHIYSFSSSSPLTKMITGLSAYTENPTGGAVTEYSYNTRGYLAQVTDPMGLTEYYNEYDYVGNLLSMTDNNANVNLNEYGAFGLTKSYFENSPETKEFTYDNLGRVISKKAVNANNEEVRETYTYDDFGRLISSTSNDGSVQNYTYDENSNMLTYNLLTLTETTDNNEELTTKNSLTYEYDELNRLTKIHNDDIIRAYDYDLNGNLTEIVQNDGTLTTHITDSIC